jgi:hypothetical protein
MDLESELRKEIEKWAKRIENEIKNIELKDKKRKDVLDNIHAYIKDSKYFADKGDLIRSFEAIIWAWAWLEIGKDLNLLE